MRIGLDFGPTYMRTLVLSRKHMSAAPAASVNRLTSSGSVIERRRFAALCAAHVPLPTSTVGMSRIAAN
jgi:hypothetical protein